MRTRFAPSPTGPLHIGGVRTALFNYLFAQGRKGEFFLRIEDTDLERSRKEFENDILSSLEWLGLSWDGSLIRQSERLSVYRDVAEALRKSGAAYEEGGALKFRVPKTTVQFEDLVHARISFDTSIFDDFVILKSNGYPAYNFACVVDDHDLKTTHVIRGDDHLSNTPRQLLIYQALGWQSPQFAHLPLVLGRDGQPLSKRDAVVDLRAYRDDGYLPDAILNYLVLLGWAPGGDREFFSREDLIRHFSLDRVHKTSAMFDIQKLNWLNGEHLKTLSDDTYAAGAVRYVREKTGALTPADTELRSIALLFKDRIQLWKDLIAQADFFLQGVHQYDPSAVIQYIRGEKTCEQLLFLIEELEVLDDFSAPEKIEAVLRGAAAKLSVPAKELIHPTRIALTGRSVSPSLFEVMKLLGKAEVLERLQKAVQHFSLEKHS